MGGMELDCVKPCRLCPCRGSAEGLGNLFDLILGQASALFFEIRILFNRFQMTP
jgi:hypothetical protein